ncbi:Molybdopterin biosynthesis protein MoeA [Desulfurella amilsii]|uniref:Molybdopterin molybdenumtransferase n=1 Tax=Desulfurella amilsii TaxID=1562698 RepID=A0A1X4XZ09_9BACT|nr:molybdopterin molybdotransferase MoeA [Desulfurella amilsii]OSS42743.1 Molybdopterin biosynthesis protein MoeA [Desulfurella amilsii]OSS42819.1 Molybdopterin biosynthesis protein MoeA [Desulfurella amilsii]
MKKNVLEALEIVLDCSKTKPSQTVFLSDSLGRVACIDILAKSDYPCLNKTAMDGYAIVYKNKDKPLKEVFDINQFDENSAFRLNTGNDIPQICDSVIEVELIEKHDGYIKLSKNVEKYRNFVFAGSEIKKGEIVIKKGELINEQKMALLAYVGEVLIEVYQKPIVGIITTGDEVVFPGATAQKGSVYNTNYFYLNGFVKKLNAECIYFGHIRDNINELVETYRYALSRCDILVSTGGSSKGTKDFTKKVFEALGIDIKFDETTVKPGKPLIFGNLGDKLVFGMPGWPSSLVVNTQVFLKPALKKLSGLTNYKNAIYYASTTKSMHSRMGKDYFNRAILTYNNKGLFIEPLESQDTSNFFSMAKANCLVWLDASTGDVENGTLLTVITID